ncbi:MAG: tetratricopeptide repeat protein, partial [Pseudomonadota bacterium]
MPFKSRLTLIPLTAIALTACAAAPTTASAPDYSGMSEREREIAQVLDLMEGTYPVSSNAKMLAVKDERGDPVGITAYDEPSDALEAGDIAAFIATVKAGQFDPDAPEAFASIITAIDAAAADDYEGALTALEPALEDENFSSVAGFIEAWTLALSGDGDAAIAAHRRVTSRLPGMTGDLSLAALLDALGRKDEALAVYQSLTPNTITAPEHEFDPQGLVYMHVQTVIVRQALLLREMGRVEEAVTLYERLAAAEPEQAVRYAAIIDSLRSGRGLDDEPITIERAYAQSLADYSLAIYFQKLINNSFMGVRERGYDTTKGMFDQLALVIDPTDEDLRITVFNDLYDENLFDGALHVLNAAPEQTASLRLAAASTHLQLDDFPKADAALAEAVALATEDEKFGTSIRAMRIYALKKNEARALPLADSLPGLAQTPAEKASAHGMAGGVYAQFGKHDRALAEARAAHAIEDTHDRRMALANAMADAGLIEEGLLILRDEALARPNDPYMLNTLGYYLVLHTDRLDEAYRVLARASALAPNDSYIADSFGWVRYKLGDLEGALRYLEISRRELLPQRHWEVEDHLGDVYWHLGRKEDAKTAWENALGEFPPADERAIIEDKLANGISSPPPE